MAKTTALLRDFPWEFLQVVLTILLETNFANYVHDVETQARIDRSWNDYHEPLMIAFIEITSQHQESSSCHPAVNELPVLHDALCLDADKTLRVHDSVEPRSGNLLSAWTHLSSSRRSRPCASSHAACHSGLKDGHRNYVVMQQLISLIRLGLVYAISSSCLPWGLPPPRCPLRALLDIETEVYLARDKTHSRRKAPSIASAQGYYFHPAQSGHDWKSKQSLGASVPSMKAESFLPSSERIAGVKFLYDAFRLQLRKMIRELVRIFSSPKRSVKVALGVWISFRTMPFCRGWSISM